MADIFQCNWKSLSSQEYLDKTRKETRVIWNSGIPFNVLNIGTRKYEIKQSYAEWREFSESCFTVHYKNNKSWDDPDAENYSLNELAIERDLQNNSEFSRKGDREFENDIILTAYDLRRDKRLIIDGVHRAVILTLETKKQTRPPLAQIYECYGENVDKIFPCDFNHF